MEVLEVSGYVSKEKAVIASRYLGPQADDASGGRPAGADCHGYPHQVLAGAESDILQLLV
jgi:hypothetical protein